jgi:hypothetical protein
VPGKLALELFHSINLPDAPPAVAVSLSLAPSLSPFSALSFGGCSSALEMKCRRFTDDLFSAGSILATIGSRLHNCKPTDRREFPRDCYLIRRHCLESMSRIAMRGMSEEQDPTSRDSM